MTDRWGPLVLLIAGIAVCGCTDSHDHANDPTANTVEATQPLRVKNNSPPQLVAEKTTHHFDKMDQDQTGSHVFEIRNQGEGELNLRIQHTSCGCTSVKLGEVEWDPKNPAPKTVVTVPPGQSVDVQMHWDTGERMGEFKTSANIESNDPKAPVVAFTVQGEIVPYIQVTQSQVRMEEIRNSEVTSASTHFYSKKFDDLQLIEVNSSNPLVTAEFEPADELFLETMKALSAVKVLIKVQPGLPIGPFSASMSFKTNKEQRPQVSINVNGNVLGAVLLSPFESLDFGTVKVTEQKTITLFVKILGDEPAEVNVGKVQLYRPNVPGAATVTVDTEILKVDLTQLKSSKNRWQLKAQVPEGSPGGKFRGVLELETSHPTAKVVKIPVRFEVSK